MDGGIGSNGVDLVCPWCERRHRRATGDPAGGGRVACAGCRSAFAAEMVRADDRATETGRGGLLWPAPPPAHTPAPRPLAHRPPAGHPREPSRHASRAAGPRGR